MAKDQKHKKSSSPRKTKEAIKTSGGEDKTTYVTVLGSQALASPDGFVAIQLVTRERGPIAFLVDQQAIDAIRRSLGIAETILHLSKGQSRPN
jgi:hypothetical protein